MREQHRLVAYELIQARRATLRSLGERELELVGRGIAFQVRNRVHWTTVVAPFQPGAGARLERCEAEESAGERHSTSRLPRAVPNRCP